ncbi:MAG: ERCC4 domain-containing protein, partial [Candidatus Heimdallarchaeota archaeon]
LNDVKRWEEEEVEKEASKNNSKDSVRIIVDSRERNSKILFYLKKEGIDLDFRQVDCGDYILSDRVALEYKKGEDLLSSIIDGRLFEQLGSLTNAYQIPILLIEGFPSGGIHPEAIAGALSSFVIDFGVSIIQTQNSEESAAIIKRIAMREQKTKKRKPLIRKSMKMGNPNENAIQVISSYPGINRTLATRLLENLGSIRKIVNASEDELKKIEGLGVKKSRKLADISNKEYEQ